MTADLADRIDSFLAARHVLSLATFGPGEPRAKGFGIRKQSKSRSKFRSGGLMSVPKENFFISLSIFARA
jgi:hypothetical protein